MDTVNRLAELALEDPMRAAVEAAATPVGYDILLSLGVLLASDVVISFGLGARGKKARWFFIHAICNAVIVAVAFLPALTFIKDPVAGISTKVIPFDRSATVIAVLHAYHLLFFKCSAADWFHHIAFVAVGTTIQFFYRSEYGSLSAFYHIVVSGAPGGVDYFILGLVDMGWVSKKKRIEIAVEINTWIRAPLLVVTAAFGYTWWTLSDKSVFNTVGACIMIFISAFNGQYYARQVLLAAGRKYQIE